MPVSHLDGPHILVPQLVNQISFQIDNDYLQWIERMDVRMLLLLISFSFSIYRYFKLDSYIYFYFSNYPPYNSFRFLISVLSYLLKFFPAYIDQTINLMKEGAKLRMVIPKYIVDTFVVQQFSSLLNITAMESVFFRPFLKLDPNSQIYQR